MTSTTDESTFLRLLREQIGHEFDAHQQYVAIAVWFDGQDLPQLAAALLPAGDRGAQPRADDRAVPARPGPRRSRSPAAARCATTSPRSPTRSASRSQQEKQVTAQIEAIFAAARAEGDALGEQFLLWFLKEQVEEVASATTLLTVATRAGDNLFDLENYVAREQIGDGGESTDAPSAAGGAL